MVVGMRWSTVAYRDKIQGVSLNNPPHALWSRGIRRRGPVLRGSALGALGRRVVGVVGQREVVRALLEADDAVDDVLGVRVDGRSSPPRSVCWPPAVFAYAYAYAYA